MQYTSLLFIFFTFIVFILYYTVPKKAQWIVLLISSLCFYYFNSKQLIIVLLLMTLNTYLFGLLIEKIHQNTKQLDKSTNKAIARFILILSILINISILVYIKYFNFLITNISNLFSMDASTLLHNFLMPIGISYYTLQSISYLVDIYRKRYDAERNVAHLLLYMSYFPQITQGPIPKYETITEQFYKEHKFDYDKMCFSLQLILWGFIKKLVIADRIAIPANAIFNHSDLYRGPIVFFGSLLYGIQIYCDFSGGIDIVRGASELFGIELENNFSQPFFATSIEEFWRRWHITLGAWMRNYVFYPLSLSKVLNALGKKTRKVLGNNIGKKIPAFIAMFIVYFLVGIWHGPSFKYIIYGLYNGGFIMMSILLENTYKTVKDYLKIDDKTSSYRLFQMCRTLVITTIGRLFSRASSSKRAIRMLVSIFYRFFDFSFLVNGTLIKLGLNTANWIILVLFIIILFAVDYIHESNKSIRLLIQEQNILLRWILYFLAIVSLIVFGMYGPAYDASSFIYQYF